MGLNSSAIGTLVERTTWFTMLLHLPRMDGHGDTAPVKNGPPLAGYGAAAVRDAIVASITSLRRSCVDHLPRTSPGKTLGWRTTAEALNDHLLLAA